VGTGPVWSTQFNTDTTEITPLAAGAFRLTRGVWRFDVTVSFFTGTATAGGCWVALRDLGTSAFHMMGEAKPTGVSGEDCVASGSFLVDSNDSLSDFQLSVKQTSGVSAQVSFHQFACEFVAAT
ncbi:MAG: hypothetical protein GY707_17895, partial [Desulfobacteraceae bacterium]|nr:hypothetical protein [Desulfobacteraceae bacterium]